MDAFAPPPSPSPDRVASRAAASYLGVVALCGCKHTDLVAVRRGRTLPQCGSGRRVGTHPPRVCTAATELSTHGGNTVAALAVLCTHGVTVHSSYRPTVWTHGGSTSCAVHSYLARARQLQRASTPGGGGGGSTGCVRSRQCHSAHLHNHIRLSMPAVLDNAPMGDGGQRLRLY